jgi:DNA-binding NarL/FixJ family response regulator
MIKILLADDHSIVRNDIRNFLEKENNIEIVGEPETPTKYLDF